MKFIQRNLRTPLKMHNPNISLLIGGGGYTVLQEGMVGRMRRKLKWEEQGVLY